jgi:hypothetical protein
MKFPLTEVSMNCSVPYFRVIFDEIPQYLDVIHAASITEKCKNNK